MNKQEYKYLTLGILFGILSVPFIAFSLIFIDDYTCSEIEMVTRQDLQTELSNFKENLTAEENAEEITKYLNMLMKFFEECDCPSLIDEQLVKKQED